MKSISKLTLTALALTVTALVAQNPALKRVPVFTQDSGVPGHEDVITRVDISPGGGSGRHTHPGDEISYILEGEGELLIDGSPARKLKAGDGLVVPAGKIHEARNTGAGPLKLVAIYVVEKGKPVATPAK